MNIQDPDLTLRPEILPDKTFLESLYRSAREDLLQLGLPDALLANLMQMQFSAQQSGYCRQYPDADCDIIEKGGFPIGYLITNRGAETIRLVYIALLPDERNRGYGRRMVRALQDEALSADKALTLSVPIQNLLAQRLYLALGFTTVGGDDGAYREMIWCGTPMRQEASE